MSDLAHLMKCFSQQCNVLKRNHTERMYEVVIVWKQDPHGLLGKLILLCTRQC